MVSGLTAHLRIFLSFVIFCCSGLFFCYYTYTFLWVSVSETMLGSLFSDFYFKDKISPLRCVSIAGQKCNIRCFCYNSTQDILFPL